jgi:hypothetical protein
MWRNKYGVYVPSVFLLYADRTVLRVFQKEPDARIELQQLEQEDEETHYRIERESLF